MGHLIPAQSLVRSSKNRVSIRQRGAPRKRTTAVKNLTRATLDAGWAALGGKNNGDSARPRTYGECTHPRPCPFVSCSKHLYLDVDPHTGSIIINRPDMEPHELADSCSLDVARRGGMTLEEVGEIMNLTRERVRQIELRVLSGKLRGSPAVRALNAP